MLSGFETFSKLTAVKSIICLNCNKHEDLWSEIISVRFNNKHMGNYSVGKLIEF